MRENDNGNELRGLLKNSNLIGDSVGNSYCKNDDFNL